MLQKAFYVVLLSMLPVIELRGAIPYGVAAGLPLWLNYPLAVVGNLLPIPVLIVFAGRVLRWCAGWPYVGRFFQRIIDLGNEKAGRVNRSKAWRWMLFIFVAIPAPGTGAWTGALIATLLQMRVARAFLPIAAGVLASGLIMVLASYGVVGALAFLA